MSIHHDYKIYNHDATFILGVREHALLDNDWPRGVQQGQMLSQIVPNVVYRLRRIGGIAFIWIARRSVHVTHFHQIFVLERGYAVYLRMIV